MNNIQLTALLPSEMMKAQANLVNWCNSKIASLSNDLIDISSSLTHAEKMKWATKTLRNQKGKITKQIQFFEKIKEALKHGYVIVPNFPITMFAIRTTGNPRQKHEWHYWGNKEQNAKELPIGEGEYRNPFPVVQRFSAVKDNEGKVLESAQSFADDWDEMEFPISMMKPEIIEATNKAMALEIFDQFGICPPERNQDPIIVGQIINRQSPYRSKIVSFMIAWHFDTRVL